MKFLSFQTIKKKINEMGKKANVPKDLYPTFGRSKDFGYPHIEVDNQGYHYVIIERGNELDRRTTKDLNQLLYWIFENITFSIASDYESKNRNERQDFRRILFAKQIELLELIDKDFSEKCERHIRNILKDNPFIDKV